MQVGIHLPHVGRKAGPDAIRRAAEQAERLGFDDIWVSEHIIIPQGAPYPPSALFYDPVLTLTWAAAFTSRVRLGTSVLVLPMRHPLPLAKELATLQNLSRGRLILGAGVGWMEAEFAALGVPFGERGRRMDEGIAMMRAVWNEDPVSFKARHIPATIEAMRMQPPPCAPIPIWIGGASEPASRGRRGWTAGTGRAARSTTSRPSSRGSGETARSRTSPSRYAFAWSRTPARCGRPSRPCRRRACSTCCWSPCSATSRDGSRPWRRPPGSAPAPHELGCPPRVRALLAAPAAP